MRNENISETYPSICASPRAEPRRCHNTPLSRVHSANRHVRGIHNRYKLRRRREDGSLAKAHRENGRRRPYSRKRCERTCGRDGQRGPSLCWGRGGGQAGKVQGRSPRTAQRGSGPCERIWPAFQSRSWRGESVGSCGSLDGGWARHRSIGLCFTLCPLQMQDHRLRGTLALHSVRIRGIKSRLKERDILSFVYLLLQTI